MRKTSTVHTLVLALSIVGIRAPLAAQGPEVTTQVVELDFAIDQFGVFDHRVPLEEEISLRGVSWVVVEPFIHTITPTGGAADHRVHVAVSSGDIKVAETRSAERCWTARQFTTVVRAMIQVSPPRSTIVDNVIFSLEQTPRDQPPFLPATGVFTDVIGHIGETQVRVHFVRGSFGDDGPNQRRPFMAPTASLQGGGDSPWIERMFDDPISSVNLRLIFQEKGGYIWSWPRGRGGVMTQLELRLEGGDHVPLDDAFSPSDGITLDGVLSFKNSLYITDTELFDGQDILGWRWRLHSDGNPTVDLPGVRDIGLYFAYDYQDCDASGVPDAEELAAGALSDCDGNGVLDPCDPDCDGNGVPDACDIERDRGRDCNQNGVLDSCELTSLQYGLELVGSVAGTHRMSAAVDFTGDGLVDLILAGSSPRALRVLEAEPGGGFRETASRDLDRNPKDVAARARSGGGALLALSLGQEEVLLYEVNATGHLAAADVVAVPADATRVILARVDDDQQVDLLVLHRSEDAFSLLLGMPEGGYGKARLFPVDHRPTSMDTLDVDGDGRVDLVATSSSLSRAASVFENLGDADWPRRDVETAARPDHVFLSARGGRLELLVKSGDTIEVFREEDGGGEFLRVSIWKLPYRVTDFELLDLDGDGRKEFVAVHGAASEVSISRRLDNGTLDAALRIVHGIAPSDIVLAGASGVSVIDTVTGEILSLVQTGPAGADLDCDRSGVLDACEIAAGVIEDLNQNQVPDVCEGTTTRFLRGDCNADTNVNLTDAVCMLNSLFEGAPALDCAAALNTNGDESVDIADPVSLLNYLFGGGDAPVAPFPDCDSGLLEADAVLGCVKPPNC